MQSTFPRFDTQPQATTGNDWQAGLPMLGLVPAFRLMPPEVVAQATFSGTLADAARMSGLDDQDIAEAMHICRGYMSRFMRGVAQGWARRLVLFMRVTHSLAPLQWMAAQVGCEVVPGDSRAAEVAQLQARLVELTRRSA